MITQNEIANLGQLNRFHDWRVQVSGELSFELFEEIHDTLDRLALSPDSQHLIVEVVQTGKKGVINCRRHVGLNAGGGFYQQIRLNHDFLSCPAYEVTLEGGREALVPVHLIDSIQANQIHIRKWNGELISMAFDSLSDEWVDALGGAAGFDWAAVLGADDRYLVFRVCGRKIALEMKKLVGFGRIAAEARMTQKVVIDGKAHQLLDLKGALNWQGEMGDQWICIATHSGLKVYAVDGVDSQIVSAPENVKGLFSLSPWASGVVRTPSGLAQVMKLS